MRQAEYTDASTPIEGSRELKFRSSLEEIFSECTLVRDLVDAAADELSRGPFTFVAPARIQPSNSVAISTEGYTIARKNEAVDGEAAEETIIPGGWDHEHCALCWQTISCEAEDDQLGYMNGKD